MDFDWKHLPRTETSQKFLLKNLFYKNKGARKVKQFQKFSNKQIYFFLQSNGTKYKRSFKFLSKSNFLEGHHILIPEIWVTTFTDWFRKCSDG